MSRELIESIVSHNMLEANDMVEAKLAEIRERKLYEMKRMFAAKMNEAMGGQDPKELRAKGYRRAIDVLGLSPYDKAKEEKKKREQAKAEREKAKETPRDASSMGKSSDETKDMSVTKLKKISKVAVLSKDLEPVRL